MIQFSFNGFSGSFKSIVFGIVVIEDCARNMVRAPGSADTNAVFVFAIMPNHSLSLLMLFRIALSFLKLPNAAL